MNLIEEKMLSSHQMKAFSQVEQRMTGEVHAVHQAIKGLSSLDSIVELDILPHQGRFADATGAAYAHQLLFPLDGVHRLPDDVSTHLGDQ